MYDDILEALGYQINQIHTGLEELFQVLLESFPHEDIDDNNEDNQHNKRRYIDQIRLIDKIGKRGHQTIKQVVVPISDDILQDAVDLEELRSVQEVLLGVLVIGNSEEPDQFEVPYDNRFESLKRKLIIILHKDSSSSTCSHLLL